MTEPFARVALVGVGTVGARLAALLARHGRTVVAIEADEPRCELRRQAVAAQLYDDPRAFARIEWSSRLADCAGAQLVIEALPEQLPLKQRVFSAALDLCDPDTVYASSTAAFPLAAVAAVDRRLMTRLVGLPLFASGATGQRAAVEPVLELAATPFTDPAVREAAAALVRSLGLTPVAVPDRPGFVGGALLMAYLNCAATMLMQGYAGAADIDAAMTLGCGLPVGPLAQLDAIGLDTAHDILTALHEQTGEPGYAPAPLLTHYVAAGLLGRKSGRGFHDYDAAAAPAPEVAEQALLEPALRSVGVVGSGTMAGGIAEVCARAGVATVLVARSEAKARQAVAAVGRSLDRAARKGRLTDEQRDAAMRQLRGTADLEALADRDLVVEAVAEELAAKREVFARLGRIARPDALLATSTSSLPVIECATASGRPDAVVGMHFFNPAPAMRLVEVVRTAASSAASVARARAAARALGKHPVDCSDRAGFIVNALLFPYLNQAVLLTERHGVSAGAVDAVMSGGHGYPMGPLRLLDVIGLDVTLQIQRSLHEASGDPALLPASSLRHLVQGGFLGRKTGRGFFSYQDDGAGPSATGQTRRSGDLVSQ
jgi:3-hydroxybutyryl-CoA dehydrogenase